VNLYSVIKNLRMKNQFKNENIKIEDSILINQSLNGNKTALENLILKNIKIGFTT